MNLQNELAKQFLIPVVREADSQKLEDVCEALADGGCRIFEITLMSPAAFKVIQKLAQKSEFIIGAGTVLNASQAHEATQSGAKFLVSPGICEELLGQSSYIPGVATATEAMHAIEKGHNLLKLFPIQSSGGVRFLKNMKAPFPNVNWMPTGGVGEKEIGDYRNAGALCVGVGGQLFPPADVEAKEWSAISRRFQTWQAQ